MKKKYFGIMVCKVRNQLFYEKEFYRFLQNFGAEKDFIVYVFFPEDIDWENRIIKGYQYDISLGYWIANHFPVPLFIYDRCFYTTGYMFRKYRPFIEKLQNDKRTIFLGHGLKGKWDVYNILFTSPKYKKFLPKTLPYKGLKQLEAFLDHQPIILKPIGGSHGSGVIKVIKEGNDYEVLGRDFHNQKIHYYFNNKAQLFEWIHQFTIGKRYIIQQYLKLTTFDDRPYDIRVLVQKNENGKWETTGMAARVGEPSNITSNLHGGGMVQLPSTILHEQFGTEKAKGILEKIEFLANQVPPFIEANHGKLFEVGLDLGVDTSGNVWIIEVNSKPGRKVFELLNDKEKQFKAYSQPILYARYLSNLIVNK